MIMQKARRLHVWLSKGENQTEEVNAKIKKLKGQRYLLRLPGNATLADSIGCSAALFNSFLHIGVCSVYVTV